MAERITIFWMTDLHLKDSVTGQPEAAGAIYAERHYYGALAKLQQSVDWINLEQPDLVVCTGDIIDERQRLDSFVAEWQCIQSPKKFVPGNHDLEAGYAAIVEQMGYSDEPSVAGSKFNCSFPLHKGNVKARVIVLDTYVGELGEHRIGTCEGTLYDPTLSWLEEEMLASPERIVLVFSHNGIGGPNEYFNQQHVAQFKALASRVSATGEGKAIINLAGHHHVHPQAAIAELQPDFTFVNGVAMIVGASSFLNVVHIYEDNTYVLDYREVKYPYAGK